MKNAIKVALIAATLAASSIAYAQVYVVGSVGSATFEGNKSDIDQELVAVGVTGLSSSLDKRDIGYKIQLGYQFNKNFAIEGGWVDLGKVSYAATFTGGNANASAKASGLNVAAIGILPVNESFSVFGKLGFIDAKVSLNVSATGPGGSASGSASSTDWKTNWGVGATYNLNKQVGLRVEYDKFDNLGNNNTTGTSDVDMISAGIVFKF